MLGEGGAAVLPPHVPSWSLRPSVSLPYLSGDGEKPLPRLGTTCSFQAIPTVPLFLSHE